MKNLDYFWERLEESGELRNEIVSTGWAYWTPNGFMDEHLLRKLADEIERRNKPFWDEYDEYCRSQEKVEPCTLGLDKSI